MQAIGHWCECHARMHISLRPDSNLTVDLFPLACTTAYKIIPLSFVLR